MERDIKAPAVEQDYEGPPPGDQRIWNQSISAIVFLVAVIFLIVLAVLLIF